MNSEIMCYSFWALHALLTLIVCYVEIWSEGSLKDLSVDSNVYAETTVNQTLAAKQLYRAVRGITLDCVCLLISVFDMFFRLIQETRQLTIYIGINTFSDRLETV